MKGLRREGETCCICLCQRESHNSWAVRSQAKRAQKVLPEHRWADMDSLSVGHHAGKLQLEVTNVSEPSWGSPSGLRHDLVERDMRSMTLEDGQLCLGSSCGLWSGVTRTLLRGKRWEQSQPGLGPRVTCVDLVLWGLYADFSVSVSNRFNG